MKELPGPVDWRALVYAYRGPGIGNGVRVLLLYLADNMRDDRTVSVPRSRIAKALAVSPAEVTSRVTAAREAGLLDVIRAGRPGTTAVYQGLMANPLGNPGVTKKKQSLGTGNPTSSAPALGTGNPTTKEPLLGNPGVATTSKHERTSSLVRETSELEMKRPLQRRTPDMVSPALARCSEPGCDVGLGVGRELAAGRCVWHLPSPRRGAA